MSSIKISFCIPTYNRAAFIEETIESIIQQATDGVEIVISDNASDDNTEEIVQGYRQKFPRLTYYRWPENMGADRNYLKVVELAKGDYCWFMGSDDALKPGAISRILEEIKQGYDIYLTNRTVCDIQLKPVRDQLWLNEKIPGRVFNLSEQRELIEYLKAGRSLGALFSYLSSIIFRRDKWNRVKYDEAFTGTAYAHVFMLLSFIQYGCRLRYIKEPLVFCRSDNDSFLDQGIVRRFLLDIDGYGLLADKFFADNLLLKKAFLNVVKRQRPWKSVAVIRTKVKNIAEWKIVQSKLSGIGYNKILLFSFTYLKNVISLVRYIKAKTIGIYMIITQSCFMEKRGKEKSVSF